MGQEESNFNERVRFGEKIPSEYRKKFDIDEINAYITLSAPTLSMEPEIILFSPDVFENLSRLAGTDEDDGGEGYKSTFTFFPNGNSLEVDVIIFFVDSTLVVCPEKKEGVSYKDWSNVSKKGCGCEFFPVLFSGGGSSRVIPLRMSGISHVSSILESMKNKLRKFLDRNTFVNGRWNTIKKEIPLESEKAEFCCLRRMFELCDYKRVPNEEINQTLIDSFGEKSHLLSSDLIWNGKRVVDVTFQTPSKIILNEVSGKHILFHFPASKYYNVGKILPGADHLVFDKKYIYMIETETMQVLHSFEDPTVGVGHLYKKYDVMVNGRYVVIIFRVPTDSRQIQHKVGFIAEDFISKKNIKTVFPSVPSSMYMLSPGLVGSCFIRRIQNNSIFKTYALDLSCGDDNFLGNDIVSYKAFSNTIVLLCRKNKKNISFLDITSMKESPSPYNHCGVTEILEVGKKKVYAKTVNSLVVFDKMNGKILLEKRNNIHLPMNYNRTMGYCHNTLRSFRFLFEGRIRSKCCVITNQSGTQVYDLEEDSFLARCQKNSTIVGGISLTTNKFCTSTNLIMKKYPKSLGSFSENNHHVSNNGAEFLKNGLVFVRKDYGRTSYAGKPSLLSKLDVWKRYGILRFIKPIVLFPVDINDDEIFDKKPIMRKTSRREILEEDDKEMVRVEKILSFEFDEIEQVNNSSVRCHAFVVGQNVGGDRPLNFPCSDALLMSQRLKGYGYLVTEEIYRLDEKKLTYSRFRSSFIMFLEEVEEGDKVVFYFSGHGYKKDGKNFLECVKNEREREDMKLSFFIKKLRKKKTVNFFFLDCCQKDQKKKLSGNTWKEKGKKEISDPISSISVRGGEFVFGFACLPGMSTLEKGGGVFTRNLLKHLNREKEIHTILRRVNGEMVKTEKYQGSVFSTAVNDLYI